MCKGSINIISWNIESITEGKTKTLKTEDSNFLKILNDNHIVCLQETIKPVLVSGFKSFCNIRKGTAVNHGGICTLVRNDLSSGVSRVNNITESPDIIVLRCTKKVLLTERDIYVINVYVSPKNSSYAAKNNYEPFEELSRVLDCLAKREDGELILMGDFNSRIGVNKDFMCEDKSSDFLPIPNEVANCFSYNKRNSEDKLTNSYKNDFLDFVLGYKLIILNGRTIGDIYGRYTCIKWNGSSLIDYGIVSSDIVKSVTSFKVLSFTEHSDHKPIRLCIRSSIRSIITPNPQKLSHCPKRFMMSDEGKDSFVQSQNTSEHKELLEGIMLTQYDDAVELNKQVTNSLVKLADSCFKSTKPWRIKDNQRSEKPWFDRSCRDSKKELCKATRLVNNFSNSDFIRKKYYLAKKGHFRYLKHKRNKYMTNLNLNIESGKVLDWKAFKKLRTTNNQQQTFDSYDMANFQTFFSKLYSDNHSTLTAEQKNKLYNDAVNINNDSKRSTDIDEILNSDITSDEIDRSIAQLKTGKSSSDDLILNDMLKLLTCESKKVIQKLFNLCLHKGVYPWHNSIVTPLHKKGDPKNPDNYRAIAVGSCMGKLLSNILLERIVSYKNLECPDPPNQMGFTKGAQTIDHIFTIKTIMEKYKKLKKKVYCVFVDLKKAFDTVPRQALLFKLAHMGITGRIFNVVRNMYSSSTMQLKLGNLLSDKIDVNKGTEQGHTLSPEFFKCYLDDLSPLLAHKDVPELNNCLISHLLWADDLVLMGLSLKTAQHLFDVFATFCVTWGLEINLKKTSMVIFGKKSLKNNDEFIHIGDSVLETVDSYTYLGLKLHMSGSMNFAISDLCCKALRATYALRRYLDRKCVSVKATMQLFDSLIKPILMYGAAIWTPYLNVVKSVIDFAEITKPNEVNISSEAWQKVITALHKKLSSQTAEKLHLKHIKWVLGVHKYASNSACWNELGRVPLLGSFMKQTLSYLDRIENLPDEMLVKKAWLEQKELKLPWYTSAQRISSYSDGNKIETKFRATFSDVWKSHLESQSKLDFYRTVGEDLNAYPEDYLKSVKDFSHRSTLTKIRVSAHRLEIEAGRYKQLDRKDRLCRICDENQVEDESHFLVGCTALEVERSQLLALLDQDDGLGVPINPLLLACCFKQDFELQNSMFKDKHMRTIAKYVFLMYNKRKKILDSNI